MVAADFATSHVYVKNSTTFHHQQTISEDQITVSVVDITGDGLRLLIIHKSPRIRIYNNINGHFTLFQTIVPSNGALNAEAGVISDDHQWVVFGTNSFPGQIEVYKFNG